MKSEKFKLKLPRIRRNGTTALIHTREDIDVLIKANNETADMLEKVITEGYKRLDILQDAVNQIYDELDELKGKLNSLNGEK